MPVETIGDWERKRFAREAAGEIESVEVVERPVAVVEPGPEPCILLERDYAGLRVEIGWHPDLGVTLFVQEGEQIGKVCTVAPEKAFDAFDHPFLYLQAAGLA